MPKSGTETLVQALTLLSAVYEQGLFLPHYGQHAHYNDDAQKAQHKLVASTITNLQKLSGTHKLLQDTTLEERTWPADEFHEDGKHACTCVHCLRLFWGHKRRTVCRVCVMPD